MTISLTDAKPVFGYGPFTFRYSDTDLLTGRTLFQLAPGDYLFPPICSLVTRFTGASPIAAAVRVNTAAGGTLVADSEGWAFNAGAIGGTIATAMPLTTASGVSRYIPSSGTIAPVLHPTMDAALLTASTSVVVKITDANGAATGTAESVTPTAGELQLRFLLMRCGT